MELLITLLLWIGAISPAQIQYLNAPMVEELRQINHDQLDAEYHDEYRSIIGIDENEVQ